jgi:hypothetical protein
MLEQWQIYPFYRLQAVKCTSDVKNAAFWFSDGFRQWIPLSMKKRDTSDQSGVGIWLMWRRASPAWGVLSKWEEVGLIVIIGVESPLWSWYGVECFGNCNWMLQIAVGRIRPPAWVQWGACIRGQRAGHGGPTKNPEIGIFCIFRILTPNLVSKILY